jgi:hypothetical protein
MAETRAFGKSWWCHGGGAAVILLMVVVSVFRHPRDLIFWAAIVFFAGHTAMTVRRYLTERKARTTATVIRHHQTHADTTRPSELVFSPPPITSIFVPVKITNKDFMQQTKKAL